MLKIGTRGSALALWQAHYTQRLLRDTQQCDSDIVVIKTEGDGNYHLTLDKAEGKGFFTKEIEQALHANQIDIAIHSFKDLPTESVPGLTIAAVPVRADHRDLLVHRPLHHPLHRPRQNSDVVATPEVIPSPSPSLPLPLAVGATVGTSSLRRKAMLKALRPDLKLIDIRGNVPTRFKKVLSKELDCVVLAAAGVGRLGLAKTAQKSDLQLTYLSHTQLCPAPAQGALAIQIRQDDTTTAQFITPLNDTTCAQTVTAERLLLGQFGGGCHLPLGAWCEKRDEQFVLYAMVAAPDGSERIIVEQYADNPEAVAEKVYLALCHRGAEQYL